MPSESISTFTGLTRCTWNFSSAGRRRRQPWRRSRFERVRPVVPVFALPLGSGRYRLIYEHPVEPPAGSEAGAPDRSENLRSGAPTSSICTVRRHPDLWLWMHRRWRDDDPDESARLLP